VETTRLGGSDLDGDGPAVSRVGLGCNQFGRKLDREATRAVIEAALEVGMTFFDTADVYGSGESERFIGAALGERRAAVVLGTKFGQDASVPGPGGSRNHVRSAIEASLERLGTDVIDLYTYHRPDGVTPLEETLAGMQELVDEGRVRWLGLSHVDAGQVAAAAGSGVTIVAVQNEYSLLHRDDDAEVLPLCVRHGIGYVPYFPLASGLLTGKYRRGKAAPVGSRLAGRQIDESDLEAVEALERVGDERGRGILELAVGGLASIPGVASVIAGATSPEQVRANAAAGEWHASEDDLDAIARALA
jgi:aryl-alcohol dehydrogenase-like predicted oxidoreductase